MTKRTISQAVESAYREGWKVNAVTADEETSQEYLDGCETVDWEHSEAMKAAHKMEAEIKDLAPRAAQLAKWFNEYVSHHRSKDEPGRTEKAERNQERADFASLLERDLKRLIEN